MTKISASFAQVLYCNATAGSSHMLSHSHSAETMLTYCLTWLPTTTDGNNAGPVMAGPPAGPAQLT